MKSATINEIKRELAELEADRLREVALRLAKYKVENKELLTYLLYEASDEEAYVTGGRREVDEAFKALTNTNLYYYKKSVRKILRQVNRLSKYSGVPQTELSLRLQFCRSLRDSGVEFQKSPVMANIYAGQVKLISKLHASLPEDLQADYGEEIRRLA